MISKLEQFDLKVNYEDFNLKYVKYNELYMLDDLNNHIL